MIRIKGKAKEYFLTFFFFVVIVAIWELYVDLAHLPSYKLVAPHVIGQEIIKADVVLLILKATLITWKEALLGFIVGATVGFLFAVLFLYHKFWEKMLLPYMQLSQIVPIIALAPIIIVWSQSRVILGVPLANVIIAAYLAFLPLVLNSKRGFDSVEEEKSEEMKWRQATTSQAFFKLVLPFSLPFFFAGLKLSFACSIIGALVGDWMAQGDGVGKMLLDLWRNAGVPQFSARLWICGLFLGAIGIASRYIITWLERQLCPWQPEFRRE